MSTATEDEVVLKKEKRSVRQRRRNCGEEHLFPGGGPPGI